MAQIRTIHHGYEPSWPASDQHPDAIRYYVCDGAVLSVAAWQARQAAAEAEALQAVFGTADAAVVEAQLAARDEERGALKSQLNEARAAKSAALAYVVDATGDAPSIEEIAAVLNPCAPQ